MDIPDDQEESTTDLRLFKAPFLDALENPTMDKYISLHKMFTDPNYYENGFYGFPNAATLVVKNSGNPEYYEKVSQDEKPTPLLRENEGACAVLYPFNVIRDQHGNAQIDSVTKIVYAATLYILLRIVKPTRIIAASSGVAMALLRVRTLCGPDDTVWDRVEKCNAGGIEAYADSCFLLSYGPGNALVYAIGLLKGENHAMLPDQKSIDEAYRVSVFRQTISGTVNSLIMRSLIERINGKMVGSVIFSTALARDHQEILQSKKWMSLWLDETHDKTLKVGKKILPPFLPKAIVKLQFIKDVGKFIVEKFSEPFIVFGPPHFLRLFEALMHAYVFGDLEIVPDMPEGFMELMKVTKDNRVTPLPPPPSTGPIKNRPSPALQILRGTPPRPPRRQGVARKSQLQARTSTVHEIE